MRLVRVALLALAASVLPSPGRLGTQVIGPLAHSATAMHISTRPLAAPAAQPDHRDSDLPHERPVKHLSADPSEPLPPWIA